MANKNNKRNHQGEVTLNEARVQEWVKNGPSTMLIEATENFGRSLQKKGLTTSQIRQVFTKLKSIEAKGYKKEMKIEFLMLKPHMAYAAGRHSSVRPLKRIIEYGINAVVQEDDVDEEQKFKNFCKLFEAILAYHRAFGGK